jgi:hypothetical protein
VENTKHAFTEALIQRAIMAGRWQKHFMLSNYTPLDWFEADCFEITKSGYFVEWEIKISLADFKADRHKEDKYFKNGKKHDRLLARDIKGPTRFYYVAPEGMIKPEDLPPWAGLWEAVLGTGPGRTTAHIGETVAAPRLHKTKLDPKVREHALGVCYWRLHHKMAGRYDEYPAVLGEGDAPTVTPDGNTEIPAVRTPGDGA